MGLAPVFKLILTSIEDLQIDDWWFSGRERGRCPAEWANVLDVRRCGEEGGRRARSSNGRRAARDEARPPRRRSMNAARRRWSINVTSHRAYERTSERCTDETIDHSRPTDGQRAAERRRRPVYRRAGDRMHGARHAADTATTTTTTSHWLAGLMVRTRKDIIMQRVYGERPMARESPSVNCMSLLSHGEGGLAYTSYSTSSPGRCVVDAL